MENSQNKLLIVDAHMHFRLPKTAQDVLKALEITGAKTCNLVAQIDKNQASETLDCLYLKYLFHNKIYVYGSLDASLYINHNEKVENTKLVEHVKHLQECGVDGIKMIEGKPDYYKTFNVPPFDSPFYEPYFKYMEDSKTPIIWHINDPSEFWDLNKIPKWAYDANWYYDDTYPKYKDILTQVERVLTRHPKLYITFAHFAFLSDNLEKLAELFEKYPNIAVDMAPGIELYENLSKDINKAKSFFNKYQNRIIYGTDIEDYNLEDMKRRGKLCLSFLKEKIVKITGDKNSLLGQGDLALNGLELDNDVLNKVLWENFVKRNNEPKKLNIAALSQELAKETARARKIALATNAKLDQTNIKIVEKIVKEK